MYQFTETYQRELQLEMKNIEFKNSRVTRSSYETELRKMMSHLLTY